MKPPLTHSLPAKVGALFLMIVLVFTLSLSAIASVCALGYGIYTEDVRDYYQTDACFSELLSDCYYLRHALSGDYALSSYYTDTGSNLRFAGYDPQTDRYLSNDDDLLEALTVLVSSGTSAEAPAESTLLDISDFANESDYRFYIENQNKTQSKPDSTDVSLPQRSADGLSYGRVSQEDIDGCTFLLGVLSPPAVRDAYSRGYSLFNTIYRFRILAPALLVICAFAAVADLIFLCCAAGHRRDQEGIVLNLQDKIPLDLYLFGVFWGGLLVLLLLDRAIESLQRNSAITAVVFSLIITAALLLCLAVLLTLCTRFKKGKWWRNSLVWMCGSLCFRLCRKMIRGIRELWRSVVLTWRVAAVCLGLTLVELLLAASRETFLMLLLNLGLTLLLCLVARQMLTLKQAGRQLADGAFDSTIDLSRLHGDLREHGENLSSLGQGLSISVEQKMRSERLKTELITNVSHDIKTPLTSIINYVDLLQKAPSPEEQTQYLAVLDRQAKRLKKLTEDLVEASKASTGNLSCHLAPTNLREILDQALGEYEERLRAAGLEPVVSLPEDTLAVLADGRLLWRVLDNLLNNACKYAQSGTRLYLDAVRQDDRALLTVKNISRQQLNLSPDELMERFVRGDSSRNTEGSGLGLNIAKSLVELQKGSFALDIDGDLFKARVTLPLCRAEPEVTAGD